MSRFCYTEEHLSFLKASCPNYTYRGLAAVFNKRFKLSKTEGQIKAALSNHGIRSGRKGGSRKLRKFTLEQRQFCVDGYKKFHIPELTKQFNKKFGTDKSESQIRAFVKNQRIKSGRDTTFSKGSTPHNKGVKGWQAGGKSCQTQFKKGCVAKNQRPVGSERVNVDGYVEVKVAEPNIWDLKQRVIWQKEHGLIEPGFNIRFRDGNTLNFDLSNLIKVSNSEHMYLTLLDFKNTPLECKDSVVLLAKCHSKIKQLKTHNETTR